MNRYALGGSTIMLGMEPRIQAADMVVKDAKMLREKLASAYN